MTHSLLQEASFHSVELFESTSFKDSLTLLGGRNWERLEELASCIIASEPQKRAEYLQKTQLYRIRPVQWLAQPENLAKGLLST